MIDPIVEEVRRTRDAHAKRFNYDLDAICKDFKSHQKKCGHPLARFSPKKNANKLIHTGRKKLRGNFSSR
ncbi:MAG: hypothetical protein WAX69_26735 [Victivallales bacterium]